MEFLDGLPTLTQVFLGFIFFLTIYFTVFQWNSATVSNVPALLTSIGIFGTFLGIAIGLMAFDVSDIKGSVPHLIDGLKTSFWSSIAGLYGALIIKAKHIYELNRQSVPAGEYTGATVDDLAGLLTDIRQLLGRGTEHSDILVQRLDTLQQTLETALQPGNGGTQGGGSGHAAMLAAQAEALAEIQAQLQETAQQQLRVHALLGRLEQQASGQSAAD